MNSEERAVYLLRMAALYIRSGDTSNEIFYDEASCDGECLACDCEAAAESLEKKSKE
jgi:hypothetical protein